MNDEQAERICEAIDTVSDRLAALTEETRESRFALLDVLTGAPDEHHRALWEAEHVLPARWANAAFDRERPLAERKYQRRKAAEAARLELHELKQRRDRMHDATRKAELAAEVRAKVAAVNELLANMKVEDAADDAAFEAAEAARLETQRAEIAATVDQLERATRARLADSVDEDEIAECSEHLAAIDEARGDARAA